MWTYENDLTKLENLIVRSNIKDGVLEFFQVYPCEGYILRMPILDEYEMDEEGNFVLDENGEKILINPYRSTGGATALPNYDWEENPSGFIAEVYEEEMNV